MSYYPEDALLDPPDAPVVHWMDQRPMTLSAPALAGALVGAFVLGALATAGALAVIRSLQED